MADETEQKKQKRDADIPDGFDVNVGRELGDGWVRKGAGVEVVGRLMGRFIGNQQDDDGKYQAFYQIRLLKACPATQKDKETKEVREVILEPGQLLNVGEHKALEELSPYTRDGGVYDVWFKYIKEDKVQGTKRTFWVIKGPRLKVLRAAKHAPLPAAEKRGEVNKADDEDIPFE